MTLGPIGTYFISFRVGVTEAGQLTLTLNGEDLDFTVTGRATGASDIVGMAIISTAAVNSVLTVRNPAGNAAALTVTPPRVGASRDHTDRLDSISALTQTQNTYSLPFLERYGCFLFSRFIYR